MGRQYWKPSNMLNPLPAVLVTSVDEEGNANIMTAAWTGNLCSDPVYVSVSIMPKRYSYELIRKSGEFVINLTTRDLLRATDYCGVRSGRDVDKFAELGLTKLPSSHIRTPGIVESPVCLECKVEQILPLGSHDAFVARVLSTDIDEQYLDANGRFDLGKADLISYSHGEYFALGEKLGKFGFSVRKDTANKKKRK